MNARERFVQTLAFGHPDRIPFVPGWPRESTLAAWRQQGLPPEVNFLDHLVETLGFDSAPEAGQIGLGVDFRMIPHFDEKVLEHRDGHYVVQDWKGNICEISDTFDVTYLRQAKDFVTRRWIRCPVENRDDWEQMKARYLLDAPGRFPPDFEQRCQAAKDRDKPLVVSFNGAFWQMREWCGFEGLCFMMIEQPQLVADMAAFWTDFCMQCLGRILRHVTPDMVYYSEDMAYKAKSMISPAMAREFCKPSWDAWTAQARKAGVPLAAIDSDGYIGELIPLWIESGVNVCDPIEVAALNDIAEYRSRFGTTMAYRGGVDKRCIAKGGQAIRSDLKRLEPIVNGGGFIPSCDHGVPPDISWPNFVDYSRLLARMTGWL